MVLRYGFSRGDRPGYRSFSPGALRRAPSDLPQRATQMGERRRSVGELLDPDEDFVIDLLEQQILMGGATDPSTGEGFFAGLSGAAHQFRIGDPSGDHLLWDGANLTITGELSAASGTFSGDLDAAGGTFAGTLSAVDGVFTGSLSAVDGTFTGELSAVDGTFSGTLQADDIEFRTDGATLAGSISIGAINVFGRALDPCLTFRDRLGNVQFIVLENEVIVGNDLHVEGDLTVDGSAPGGGAPAEHGNEAHSPNFATESAFNTHENSIGNHADVGDVSTPSGDDVLTFNGVEWVPQAIPDQSPSGATEPAISIEDANGTVHDFNFEDGVLKTYSSGPA